MLLELHISGLGVIDDVTLELSPGLNALTGETGAGKTMVTVGLALALGQRAQQGLVRSGAARMSVEARFSVQGLHEWAEDGELVLARTVSPDGRSTARAGGQLCPVSSLAELGRELVEVHGQHQTGRLLSPAAHLAFVDRFAGAAHLELVDRYRSTFRRLRAVRDRLDRLDAAAREREREKDLLTYQVREIEGAAVSPGEGTALEAERSRLEHAERLRERALDASQSLVSDGGAADTLRAAEAALRDAARVDREAEALAERLGSLAAEAGDAGEAVRGYLDRLELDPARLEVVRERLAAIRALERKYGEGEEMAAFHEQACRRLAELERQGDERASLVEEADALEAEARETASSISNGRAGAAPALARALETELHALGMEGAVIEARIVTEPELGSDGAESCTLLFAGGASQDPQPLQRVASGGELSRTMLACRSVLADLDDVPTLVFDEVDAGIGGRAGIAVGRRLARLARERQVLVVTHLPQIAAFADRQFRVTKRDGDAVVAALEGEDRVEELSRMLAGLATDEAAAHAEQLLAEAARERS